MDKLNAMGIGPKLGLIMLPWILAVVVLMLNLEGIFEFSEAKNKSLFITGLALVVIGSIMYFTTVPLLLKGIKETKLITSGPFYLCRNPLYSSLILFVVPGISLIINSWLVLSISVLAYFVFKILIKSEVSEMEKFFGDSYSRYKSETPEFFPFPLKKWFR